jgi:hypothetical protein
MNPNFHLRDSSMILTGQSLRDQERYISSPPPLPASHLPETSPLDTISTLLSYYVLPTSYHLRNVV